MAQTSQTKKFGEVIKVSSKTVSCDGGSELPHPNVFLSLKKTGKAVCPYCSAQYVYKK